MEIVAGILIAYSVFAIIHFCIMRFCLHTFQEPNIWSFLYLLFTPFTFGTTLTSILSANYEEVVSLDRITVVDHSTHLTYRWYSMEEFTQWINYLQQRGEEETILQFSDLNIYMKTLKRDIEKEIVGVDQKGAHLKLYFALREEE